MKQIEFEDELREMKRQKNEAIRPINDMQLKCKEDMVLLNQQLTALYKQKSRLKAECTNLASMRNEVEKKWAAKIDAFYKENHTCERQLEDLSVWSLVNELLARGFTGSLVNAECDEKYLADINRKLSGTHEQEQGQQQ